MSIANLDSVGRGVRLLGVDGAQLSVGQSVDAGDLTGDGIDDLVVGVPREESERGGAYIVPGPLEQDGSLDDLAEAHLRGADANGSFGSIVRLVPSTPDCDDSGYPTLHVVAQSTSEGMSRQAGAVYNFDFSGVMPGDVGSAPSVAMGRVQGATQTGGWAKSRCGGLSTLTVVDLVVSAWPGRGRPGKLAGVGTHRRRAGGHDARAHQRKRPTLGPESRWGSPGHRAWSPGYLPKARMPSSWVRTDSTATPMWQRYAKMPAPCT